jgi:hypothetical protein
LSAFGFLFSLLLSWPLDIAHPLVEARTTLLASHSFLSCGLSGAKSSKTSRQDPGSRLARGILAQTVNDQRLTTQDM